MTKPPALLESPKRRLGSAKRKIRRLEKRIATFFKNKPGRSVSEVDANGVTTHAFKFSRKIPDSWADIAVEAIEALRSSLDQCGYAVAVRSGVPEPKNAYFPFGDTPAELDANTKGRCKDLPPEISALFRSFDSHEGGNYSLWALNKLCNANKHRLLMPVGMMSGDTIVNRMKISGGTRVRVPTFDREKNYIVIAETDPGTQFEYDIKLSFFVAFDEFNGVKAGPAVGILDAIASEVDRVIRATEAECRRLGWE
jgi:hypothetical protein